MNGPTVTNIKRRNGIASQYQVSATVQYDGEAPETVTFVSSTYGPPIVMISEAWGQVYVDRRVLDRIGSTLDAAWVHAFYAPHEPSGRTLYWQAQIHEH